MKKIVLRIISAICMVLLCFSMVSCSNPEGLNMGFKGKWIGTLPDVHFGIQSDKTEFDISNVTLDFSYGDGRIGEVGGYIGNYVEGADEIEDCPIVCVAVYFYNSRYGDTFAYKVLAKADINNLADEILLSMLHFALSAFGNKERDIRFLAVKCLIELTRSKYKEVALKQLSLCMDGGSSDIKIAIISRIPKIQGDSVTKEYIIQKAKVDNHYAVRQIASEI